MRQIGERPVQREMRELVGAAGAALRSPLQQQHGPCTAAKSQNRVSLLLGPFLAAPTSVERVEKQRRWTPSTPLAWARVKDMHTTGFPDTNGCPRPVSWNTCTGLSGWAHDPLSCAHLVRIWPHSFYLKAGRFLGFALIKFMDSCTP